MTATAREPVTELAGVLNVRKARGWTSHDVVAKVRRLAGQRRVGHAGTLDPLAEGVLPVLLGRATRLADFVGEGRKRYLAEVRLGVATTTDDAEGDVTEERPVPDLSVADVEQAAAAFRGTIQQVPPAYSAVKVAGRPAYAAARKGAALELAARPVTIYSLDVLWLRDDTLALDVRCSRGTYVRSLARDLARALGTVGHLQALVRTEVGSLTLDTAVTLEQAAERGVAACLQSADAVLSDRPAVQASDAEIAALAQGRTVPADGLAGDAIRVHDRDGRLVLVASGDGERLRSRVPLLPQGELLGRVTLAGSAR